MSNISIQNSFSLRRKRLLWVSTILIFLLLFLSIASLIFGNTIYSISTIINVLFGKHITGATFAIKTLRLPRLLAGLFSGFAFGVAGSSFQRMLGNPLASPDIIGVTSGTTVAAVFCLLVLRISGSLVSVISVVFGLIIAFTIFILSRHGHYSGGRLILIGIGVQAILRSIISYLLLKASQYDIPGALRWLSGNLNTINIAKLSPLFIVVPICTLIIVLFGRQLRLLELGDAIAYTLGIHTDLVRIVLVINSVILIAFATAITGPIAFVSFISGPIASKLIRPGSPYEIPSGLVGAIVVLLADFIGQHMLFISLPVGVITGIIGAPYLIFLLLLMNKKGVTS